MLAIPILAPLTSGTQRLLSEPTAMPPISPAGAENLVTKPEGASFRTALFAATHTFPSAPTAMSLGSIQRNVVSSAAWTRKSVMVPAGVTFATFRSGPDSAIQRFPSGPSSIPLGISFAVGNLYSVTTPVAATLATLPAAASVNQTVPSGALTIPSGPLPAVGIANSVNDPDALSFAILLAADSTVQTEPSDATVTPAGLDSGVG